MSDAKGPLDMVSDIIRFEEGVMEESEIFNFFARLYNTGALGGLQGSYQRAFADLQNNGVIVIVDGKAVVVEED